MTFSLTRDVLFRHRALAAHRARMRIATPPGIDVSGFVPIGGLEQWISLRGDDRENPVLLIVHGGPGATTSIFTPLLRSWERRFTVAQWDQRGAGKTFGRHGARGTGPLSLERSIDDGIAVAEHLCARMGKARILLLGSSAGSAIALSMVRKRPELFHAYVGTDQLVGGDREGAGLSLVLSALKRSGRHRDAARLARMGADPHAFTPAMVDARNRLIASVSNGAPNMITDVTLPALFSSPQHGPRDILDMARGLQFSLEALGTAIARFDARAGSMRFPIPFIVLQGAQDVVTPAALAQRFTSEIEAPHKVFGTLEGGGHLAAFARPEAFLSQLSDALASVLPARGGWGGS